MTTCTIIKERSEHAVVVGTEEGYKDMEGYVVTPTDEVGDVKKIIHRDNTTGDIIVTPTAIARTQTRSVKLLPKHTKTTQHSKNDGWEYN